MNAAETITALPGAREWRGVAREREALVGRILTHLCRRIVEGAHPPRLSATESDNLVLAVHIVRHCGYGEPPCEGCEERLAIRLFRAMAEGAGAQWRHGSNAKLAAATDAANSKPRHLSGMCNA